MLPLHQNTAKKSKLFFNQEDEKTALLGNF